VSLAVDSDGNRVAPTKGARAICPGCGGEMLAKCGSIVRHHWAHVSNEDCDTWSESISPWHAAWQDCFPFECQEVWLGENNEHRADVKGNVRILEVQKSPLSQEKIIEREEFYGDMAWMLCGEDFESNFEILGECEDSKYGPCLHFLWKRMRTSWLAARKPIFIHFSKGIGLIRNLDERGRGIIEFFPVKIFAKAVDARFDPSHLYLKDRGFKPLIEGFVEQCNNSSLHCHDARSKNTNWFSASWKRWDDLSGGRKAWLVRESCLFLTSKLGRSQSRHVSDLLRSYNNCFRSNSKPRIEAPISFLEGKGFDRASLFCYHQSVEDIKKLEQRYLDYIGAGNAYLESFDNFINVYGLVSDALGASVIELAEQYRQRLKNMAENKSFVFKYRLAAFMTEPMISAIKDSFFQDSILYGLQCCRLKRNEPGTWGRASLSPSLDEFKAFFALMPEDYRATVRSCVNETWAKSERERKLFEREAEEDRKRWELQQRNIKEEELRERMNWSLEKATNCFMDSVNGELVGEFSLAEALVMDPGASWADEVDEKDLLAARAKFKNFDPKSIYKL